MHDSQGMESDSCGDGDGADGSSLMNNGLQADQAILYVEMQQHIQVVPFAR